MTIYLRSIKGSPLSNAEVDANFTYLNDQVNLRLLAATYTPQDILAKLVTVAGDGSNLSADLLDGYEQNTLNVANTIVRRNASGNFSAGTITANLTGNVTGNVTGNLTGTVTGNATNVNGIVAITNGGTGATTDTQARTNLGLGSIAMQNANAVTITGGTITGITDLTVADGGTGASTAAQARTNLGLAIGTDVQAYNANLTALSSVNTNGILIRTGTGTSTARKIVAGSNVSITNGDGVAGDIVINALGVFDSATVTTFNVTNFNISTTLASAAINSTTGDTNSSIQVRNSGGTGDGAVAAISYLAQGTYGIKQYIRADGFFGLGGWSRGAWSWYSDPSGNMVAAGNVTAYSDPRLKENFQRVDNPMNILNALDGGTFNWKSGIAHTENKAGKRDYGVLADQVEAVMPEIVTESVEIDGEKYKTVAYEKLVPVLIEAIKELSAKVEQIESRLS